jgi:dihydrofolate reductase
MIDEINTIRLPVLLGSGLTFLGDFGTETRWMMEDYTKYDSGAMLIKYTKSIHEAATA